MSSFDITVYEDYGMPCLDLGLFQKIALAHHIEDELNNLEGYEYVDNFRLARKNNADEMKRYKAARENGCCGSHDAEIKLPWPISNLLFGFNYGH